MTSTARFSCVTPAPNMPGSILRSTAFSAAERRGSAGRSPIPACAAAHQTSPSCTAPDAVTPQASAWAGVATKGASPTSAAIDRMLKKTGAAAAAVNRPMAFSTPETRAVRQMKTR